MAHHNVATSGANQTNLTIALFNIYKEIAPPATAVAVAQQFGSPLDNRHTYRPLEELIRTLNGAEIAPRYYHGCGIYDGENATVMGMGGDIKTMCMDEIVCARDGEAPTSLGTIIACLSVCMSKTELCHVTASAIMIVAHGNMDASLQGDFGILRSKLDKYATAVLSRDSMCNKRENTMEQIRRIVRKRAPTVIKQQSMFLPPRSQAEYGDFAEFLAQIVTTRADGTRLYTRSVKLMALALLLAHYGWQIDISIDLDDGDDPVPIKGGVGALLLVYFPTGGNEHEYIESHVRYATLTGTSFYPTFSCNADELGSSSSLHFSDKEIEQSITTKAYKHVKKTWCDNTRIEITFSREGGLCAQIHAGVTIPDLFSVERQDKHATWIVERFLMHSSEENPIAQIIVDAVSAIEPGFDWQTVQEQLEKMNASSLTSDGVVFRDQSNLAVMLIEEIFQKNESIRSSVIGAILALIDQVVGSLVNVPENSHMRMPVGESIDLLVSHGLNHLEGLFDKKRCLLPGDAIILCAARLAGVNPGDLSLTAGIRSETVIGYWNGQQGILLSPVLRRSLFWDQPEDHKRPLTLYNVPIIGIPTDDGGWIKAATTYQPVRRNTEIFTSTPPLPCKVVIQYRPYFEMDSTAVVAAVYLEGVFYDLLPLTETLLRSHTHPAYEPVSVCEHNMVTLDAAHQPVKYLGIGHLDPGIMQIPSNEDEIIVIGPHVDLTSRFFAFLLYQEFEPIIQSGCMSCAKALAQRNRSNFVIANIERT